MREKITAALAAIWDGIKVPLFMFCLFWISGIGFYNGIVHASKLGELTTGKSILITVFDLKRGE